MREKKQSIIRVYFEGEKWILKTLFVATTKKRLLLSFHTRQVKIRMTFCCSWFSNVRNQNVVTILVIIC